MKNQTIVFKISPNLKEQMISFYQDRFYEKTPPYAVFQVRDYDCIITLYESGKVMFQGLGADIEASYWTEQERILNKRDIDSELKKDQEKKDAKKEEMDDPRFKNVSTVGSDEVGTGDYFGPIVVTASYVDIAKKAMLYELGVRDSKKVTDEKIRQIGPTLIKEFPHVTYILTPKEYNERGITNMNKVKAILHNKALVGLLKKNVGPYRYIVIDQFCYVNKYFEHIKSATEQATNITFTTHAEDKCLSVAVSSIISRYIFLIEMDKLSKELGGTVPKGPGENADKFGIELVKKYGISKLNDVAKLNFKNTDKIKKALQIK